MVMTAVTAQARSNMPGSALVGEISADTMKIPEPIIEPVMMAVESKGEILRWLGGEAISVGKVSGFSIG